VCFLEELCLVDDECSRATSAEKESGRFLKKRRKIYFEAGPAAAKPARLKLTKFFASFCSQKEALSFNARAVPR
jgi:hypothetical protein